MFIRFEKKKRALRFPYKMPDMYTVQELESLQDWNDALIGIFFITVVR